MSWGEWMIVKLSVEEELKLERSVRDLQYEIADEKVGRLCGSLLKQVYFYQAIVKQAVHHIAILELQRDLGSRPKGFRQRLRAAYQVFLGNSYSIKP